MQRNSNHWVNLQLLVWGTFVLCLRLRLSLELATLHNLHYLLGLVTGALGHVLDGLNNLVAFKDLAEHDVTAVQPTVRGSLASYLVSVHARSREGRRTR